MKKKWISLLLAVVLAVLPALPSGLCQASAVQVVRVGYIPDYGVINEPQVTGRMGYGYDYLAEIARYTGWTYQYVPGTFDQLEKMLLEGKVDLIAPVQKTTLHSEELLYSSSPMTRAVRTLVVPEESDIYYDDYPRFNNLQIGAANGTTYGALLQEFGMRNAFTPQVVNLPGNELTYALDQGGVTAIVTSSLHHLPGTKVVSKIDTVPYYFAVSRERQDLMNMLDYAIEKISFQSPLFVSELDAKYYAGMVISPVAFTKGESIFVAGSPALRVAADPALEPYCYWDYDKGGYSGIMVDVLERLGQISGFTFEYLPAESYADACRLFDEGQADLLLGNFERTDGLQVVATRSFLEAPLLLVGEKSQNTLQRKLTVAVPSLSEPSCQLIMQRNPQYQYKDYGSTHAVLQALFEGKEDMAALSSYVFDEMVRKVSTRSYYALETGVSYQLSVGVSPEQDPIVLAVLNKSIDRLNYQGISDILYQNTVSKQYSVPMSVLLRENVSAVAVVVVLLSLICTLIVARMAYLHRRKMERLAYVDAVTGLSTFARFRLDVAQLLRGAAPGQYILISMDINNFKLINDSLGYDVGNQLLVSLGKRLQGRRLLGQYMCRSTGDQFLVFAPSIPIESIRADFTAANGQDPLLDIVDKADFRVTFSVGVYYIEDPTDDFYRMVDKCNIARKLIKGTYTNNVAEFTAQMSEQFESNKDITLGMERGLKNREFQLYLQPKYALDSSAVSGAEALVRWQHPERGLIMPGDFIPLFEKNGFILKLDLYMFEEVCRQLRRWQDNGSAMGDWRISVNLSRYCMNYPGIVESLSYIAHSYGVDTARLEIELTETIVEENIDKLVAIIKKLKAAGFEVSIDDFGSGYSSLNLLTDLPVDTIKLDKGFLQKVYETEKGKEVISRIISMIRALKMHSVAEGVETREQMEYLRGLGCNMGQGYYFARPVTIHTFEDLCGLEHSESDD